MLINVLEYLEEAGMKFPGKTAFTGEGRSITYSGLIENARRIASYILDNTNNEKGKPVVVFIDRNIESLVMFMGVAYCGNFYVPIDMQMPKQRVELILKTLGPVAAAVLGSDLDYVRSVSPDLTTIIYEEAIGHSVDMERLSTIRRNTIDTDPLYATFTSGSTGLPKGVITCHRSVIDLTENLVEEFGFSEESIFGNQNPFYFDASIKDIFCTLKCGATMHIIPKDSFLFPGRLVEFLVSNKVNSILWSAAAIALVANTNAFENSKPECLEKVFFSGEVMHNKVLNYWRRALPATMFVNLYGPTEITSVCSFYIVDRKYEDNDPLPIGRPFRNTAIMLLKDDGQPVQGDEIGEICVRGCCLSMGYYNNPEKTREAFCQNPLNDHFPEIVYRTGDLAKYNSEGLIMFLARKDDQVKHMGHRVELGEIEVLINSLELIDASISFYDHEKQKIVLIYKGKEADKKYIINGIKDQFPKYMYPNIMISVEEMPYNMNGKIDRVILKKMYQNGELT
jgi:D-alanine--poly(phosphoribitol) ligase subunit 1